MARWVGETDLLGEPAPQSGGLGRVEAWPAAPAVVAVPLEAGRHRAKRVVEVIIAFVALIALAPLFVALALLVATTSRGPVLFRQTRIGMGGGTFTMIKFRTMRAGAERERDRLWHLNEASGPIFKIRRDPRLTPVGRWLRRYSLDELPQLLNVLGGTMALVGPRPVLPEEGRLLTAAEQRRHLIRPGLTGLAQVSGRSHLSWADVVALDLQYVDQCSLRLDLGILVRTIGAVVLGRGAY